MTMLKCPHCGSSDGVYVKATATALVDVYFDASGKYVENTTGENLNFTLRKVARCAGCGRIRRDVDVSKLKL